MCGLMEDLLAKYKLEKIEDGDLFVANDPHVAGGTHLPDINLAMPVFLKANSPRSSAILHTMRMSVA